MTDTVPPLIVMGVSGCGKSTIGALLAQRLELEFIDGDDLHPAANKEKMAAGQPLDDDDRWPWLRIIAERIADAHEAGRPIVVACSALKRDYRDVLVSRAPETVFVHLAGDKETIAERQKQRHHEYMPDSLLDSQFAALEPLQSDERAVVVDLRLTPDEIVDTAVEELSRRYAPADSGR